jgi:hypothetical protein
MTGALEGILDGSIEVEGLSEGAMDGTCEMDGLTDGILDGFTDDEGAIEVAGANVLGATVPLDTLDDLDTLADLEATRTGAFVAFESFLAFLDDLTNAGERMHGTRESGQPPPASVKDT